MSRVRRTEKRAFFHCQLRAWQRYGLVLTLADYRRLNYQILCRDPAAARLIVRQRGGAIWLALLHETWCVVAWSDGPGRVTTFLPVDAQFDDAGALLYLAQPG